MQTSNTVQKSVRVAGVTTGLVVSGTVAGAVIGMILLAVLGLAVDGLGGFPDTWFAFVLAALAGAPIGGIGVPVLAWTLLRDVSFGRMLVGTTAGAVLGGTIGLVASGRNPNFALAGAALGFVAGAGVLRWLAHRNRPVA